MSIYGVSEYLERAKSFIALGDENSLRHACLELRFSLESIVYQKLGQLGDQLPPAVYRTWNPAKALKLLRSFEPNADQDAHLSICLSTEDGQPNGDWLDVGEYKMFPAQWLYRNYNKLGRFLHVTSLPETDSPPELNASMIETIVDEIERVASANLIMTMNSISVVKCTLCDANLYVSNAQIEQEAEVECYGEKCNAKHQIKRVSDVKYVIGRAGMYSLPCKGCGHRMPEETFTHGKIKACPKCGLEHLFRWSYGARIAPVANV
ncbi:hypothetical protein ACU7AI_02295 [Pseudomonas aeruginosa]